MHYINDVYYYYYYFIIIIIIIIIITSSSSSYYYYYFQQEAFTRVFCQNYQKIAKALVQNGDQRAVEQLSNRVVHVSVQLFSNKILAEKVVQEQNLLQIMVKVLHDMARPLLQPFRRGGKRNVFISFVEKSFGLTKAM